MEIPKVLMLILLVVNYLVPSFHFALANDIHSDSSALTVKISYKDLFDIFGNAKVADFFFDEDDDVAHEEKLIRIIRENPHEIDPLLRKIEAAFGTTIGNAATANRMPALGFLEVTDLPLEMVNLRKSLLPQASELANLSAEELQALEKPETGYSIGWSHGRESFRVDDTNENDSDNARPKRIYDTAKGSFYMNPFADTRTTNVYPPSMQPKLEEDLLRMTRFMSDVGLWIAILCDVYLDTYETTNSSSQEQECTFGNNDETTNLSSASPISSNRWVVYKSLKDARSAAKARLLYYFPQSQQQQEENQQISTQTGNDIVYDDWCGWHTDHGTLTALLPGMLCVEDDNVEDTESVKTLPKSSSDPKPGLYIKRKFPVSENDTEVDSIEKERQNKETRQRLVHVDLAPDSLGFQLGETLEILSRGRFVATPHAVKAPRTSAFMLGRASLAVFLQPLASQILPPLSNIDRHQDNSDYKFSLRKRWRSTFGEFQRTTIESFS